MRVMVLFDLPTITEKNRAEYRKFHKFLIQEGFIMMQESVYCRMVLNATVQKSVEDMIRSEKPNGGIVQMLTVTEKQFAGMSYITGSRNTDVIDSDERLVIL